MSASESRQVFEELARRIGLEGEEFTAWVDAREAARLQEEREQLEFEREMEEEERELEEMKLKTLQLKLKLAEVEKTRIVKKQCSRTPCMSTNEQAAEGCYVGSTFLREESNLVIGGGSGFQHEHFREPGAQPESNVEDRGASRRSSGELDEAEDSFAGVEQKSSSWDGLYFGASGRSSIDNNEERVPPGSSEDRAWVVSVNDNAEYPLADSMAIVTNYSCGPLDAAAWDMGTVVEDQLDGSHKNVTFSSDGGEDVDVSSGTEVVSPGIERISGEFHKGHSGFEKKWDGRPIEKVFGSFGRMGTMYEEVTVPLDNYRVCHVNFEVEVDNTECLSSAVDTCRAGTVECHAVDLVVREGSSQDDANGVCPSEGSEFHVEEYRAVATDSLGVPLAAVRRNTMVLEDHTDKTPQERLASEESGGADVSDREHEVQNVSDEILESTAKMEELQLENHRNNLPPVRLKLTADENADGDLSNGKCNDLNGRVEKVQESPAKVGEPHLENPSMLDVHDTSSVESTAFSRASYGSECVSPEASDALPALQLQESVEIHEEVIRTQLVSYAWWQGRSFECNLSLYAACKVTWRWRVFRRSYRWAFGPTRFRVSVGLVFRRLESAIRLVWDAIT